MIFNAMIVPQWSAGSQLSLGTP